MRPISASIASRRVGIGRARRVALPAGVYYKRIMKTLTVRLPDELAQAIEAESRAAGVSKSDIVRRRLEARAHRTAGGPPPSFYDLAADLIGAARGDGRPNDLSARTKHYLREWGYGKARRRR